MRILVTGGAGFIGSNLAHQLASLNHEVTVADDFSSAHWSNLISFKGDIFPLDIADDITALTPLAPFEAIYHQASITDTTVIDQRKMMSNVEGFRNILNLAQQWKSRVIWAGSASVYGKGQAPNRESAAPGPLNVYGYSKLAMEHLADLYRAKLSRPIIGLRYFNVYGPGEDHKGRFASMVHQLAKQMRAGNRPRVFKSGEQRRDFVYVGDVVQANLNALESNQGGSFNVGSGNSWTFNQVVSELNRALKTHLEPDYFENPYSFTQDWTEADLTESRRQLKYEPKYDLARGIAAYLASGKLGVAL